MHILSLPATLLSLLLVAAPSTAQSNTTTDNTETTDSSTAPNSKRGLPYIYSDDSSDDFPLYNSPQSLLTWYYNWSPNPSFPSSTTDTLQFIPMIHSLANIESDISTLQSLSLRNSEKYVLVFNEPDGTTEGGGIDTSPRAVARAWMESIAPLRQEGWKVSLPATTGSENGLEWLARFNESCYEISADNGDEDGDEDEEGRSEANGNGSGRGCQVDFLATHWYGDFPGLASWLGTLHALYPDLNIWLTEFAIPSVDEEDTLAMLNQSLTYLDELEYVVRYGWFGAFRAHEANEWTGDGVSLLDEGGGLTEVGVAYLGGEERGFEVGMEADGEESGACGRGGWLDWRAWGVMGAVTLVVGWGAM